MKRNLLILSCILVSCFGAGVMNSSAQQDFNFKGRPLFCESKKLFEKNVTDDRLYSNALLQPPQFKKGYKNASASSLVHLFDSIYFWNWDTITAAWETEPHRKEINFGYDANYNFLGFETQTWDGSTWTNEYRWIYSYDANNNDTSELYQLWNGSAWDNSSLTKYSYDINNNITSRMTQTWNGTSWVNQDRALFTYDANNNLLTELYQSWNGSNWDNLLQYLHSYDASNNRVQSLMQSWNGAWTDNLRDSLSYNAANKVIYLLSEHWNGSSWDDLTQEFYTYDVNNNLTDWLLEQWNGATWDNYYQHIYTYDANNNVLTHRIDLWSGLAWVQWAFWNYYYDVNNFMWSYAYRFFDASGIVANAGDSARFYFHTVTGIADVAADDEMISVFPNPVGNEFSVSGSGLGELRTIEIFDVTGQLVYREYFPKGDSFLHAAVDVSELRAGVYFVEVGCGEKVWRRKVVKGEVGN